MIREKMNILVVDDEQSYREVLKMILTAQEYTVETAGNGKEALKISCSGQETSGCWHTRNHRRRKTAHISA